MPGARSHGDPLVVGCSCSRAITCAASGLRRKAGGTTIRHHSASSAGFRFCAAPDDRQNGRKRRVGRTAPIGPMIPSVWMFFVAFLFAGPALASFRCPAKGGAAWREYRSAHFIVDTDAGRSDVQPFVHMLEHMHALVLQALVGEQVEIPGHLRVLAFADQTDFHEMGGDSAAGYYSRGEFGEPTIALPLRALWSDPEAVAHELAHHISFFLFPVQPRWFTEGLAEWVQTVAARPTDTALSFTGTHIARGTKAMAGAMAGSIPVNLVSWLGYDARPLPAKELLSWNGVETASAEARGHLWSWMLYHWLWNERSKAFADYQKRLADGGDPDGAWRAVFPELDPSNADAMAKLDGELDRYRTRGRFAFYKVQAEGDAHFQRSADLVERSPHPAAGH